MTYNEIIQALKHFTPGMHQKALREAMDQFEALKPALLESLDFAYENRKKLMEEKPDYFFHKYAMFLLAQYKEKEAFPKLVRILNAEESGLHYLLGDILTEDYYLILTSTFNGDTALLKQMIEGKTINQWARKAAADTLIVLYLNGVFKREEIVDYYRTLLQRLSGESMSVLTGILLNQIIDARFTELLPEVRILYDKGLVDIDEVCPHKDFIKAVNNHKIQSLKFSTRQIDDALTMMEKWAELEEFSIEDTVDKNNSDNGELEDKPDNKDTGLKQTLKKIGRNDPCPCDSGKKYKKCCMGKESLHPGLFYV
ncbi:MAG: DUF1186 domain-containing protein [Treponema sp.]|jgi:hypothetical protein|nr:DUF1186 domain-containing protein [Treponema sp.]